VDQSLSLGLYNYGHFTSMLVHHGSVRGLDLHLQRLVSDCAELFAVSLEPATIRALIARAAAPGPDPIAVRVSVYDPDLELIRPGKPLQPRILVTTRPVGPAGSRGPAGLRLRTVTYVRDQPQIKHVGLFGLIHRRRQAQLDGYDDVLLTGPDVSISEGATWNVGFWDGESVIWPLAAHLPGVAMRLIDRELAAAGVPTRRVAVTVAAAQQMRAGFATNAVTGLRPIASIDDVPLACDDDVIEQLTALYLRVPPTAL
jgi:branched-subunit amino acid aminotransferase/4-amino-4-deoxychorismate lyase